MARGGGGVNAAADVGGVARETRGSGSDKLYPQKGTEDAKAPSVFWGFAPVCGQWRGSKKSGEAVRCEEVNGGCEAGDVCGCEGIAGPCNVRDGV